MALATSLASARVGFGLCSMEASIWVAVMTGLPFETVVRMIFFCVAGTSARGSSTPMSPRATMMPSAAATISSRLVTPALFSILAIIGILTFFSMSISLIL